MNERGVLICLHSGLVVLQVLIAALAILYEPKLAAIAPIISGFQAKLPDPFKKDQL